MLPPSDTRTPPATQTHRTSASGRTRRRCAWACHSCHTLNPHPLSRMCTAAQSSHKATPPHAHDPHEGPFVSSRLPLARVSWLSPVALDLSITRLSPLAHATPPQRHTSKLHTSPPRSRGIPACLCMAHHLLVHAWHTSLLVRVGVQCSSPPPRHHSGANSALTNGAAPARRRHRSFPLTCTWGT